MKLIFSFLITWLLLYKLIPNLNSWLIDRPNSRSSHVKDTPRGGGIAFVTVSIFFLSITGNFIALICLPLSIVGLIDDKFRLSSKLRYICQFLTALVLIFSNSLIEFSQISLFFSLLSLIFLLISSTAIINFTNFMDGIDGLVSGCMIVNFFAISIICNNDYFILVGALIGFILWNWSPAKVFMGDVGSTFLGAVFAGAVLHSSNLNQALALLLISMPLFADSIVCILRRLLNGQNIFQPHKLHLYQRLHQSGWSHSKVSIVYITSHLVLFLSYLVGGLYYLIFSSLCSLLCGIYLDQKIAIPFYRDYH